MDVDNIYLGLCLFEMKIINFIVQSAERVSPESP